MATTDIQMHKDVINRSKGGEGEGGSKMSNRICNWIHFIAIAVAVAVVARQQLHLALHGNRWPNWDDYRKLAQMPVTC